MPSPSTGTTHQNSASQGPAQASGNYKCYFQLQNPTRFCSRKTKRPWMVHQLNGHSLGADLAPGPAKTSGCCPLKCSPVETPVPLSHLQETHRPVLPCSPALWGLCPWCGRLIQGARGVWRAGAGLALPGAHLLAIWKRPPAKPQSPRDGLPFYHSPRQKNASGGGSQAPVRALITCRPRRPCPGSGEDLL